MITIKKLIEILNGFDQDCLVYDYEGELVVFDNCNSRDVAAIELNEGRISYYIVNRETP